MLLQGQFYYACTCNFLGDWSAAFSDRVRADKNETKSIPDMIP